MNTRQMLMFCAGSLALSLGAAAVLFPFASVSRETLQASRSAQPVETLGEVDLGPDFGTVPVTELVGYYIENPPAAPEPGVAAAPKRQQFGGC